MSSITPKNCPICGIPANLKCSGCKNVVYCGKDHQKLHWRKEHKGQCKCYEITRSDELGRYIIATRDIKKGEIILRDNPVAIGPKVISYPMCLGCHKLLYNKNDDEKKLNIYKCSKCQWPLCNSTCENSKFHANECEIMTKKKFFCSLNFNNLKVNEIKKESAYCVILPLRVMLLKEKQIETYNEIMKLEHHLEQRQNTRLYNVLKANLITFFKTVLNLSEFDENDIMRIAAILDTNCFEIRQFDKAKLRALYLIASLFSHDCIPNTRHVFDTNNQIICIASVDIKKGSIITTSYTHSLKSTIMRREHLKISKCFDCTCARCSDPTEFDTFMGAILCSKCRIGKIISTDPLDNTAIWKCQLCSHQLPAKQIIWGNSTIQKEIESLDKTTPKPFEEFIIRYQDILHEKNTHVLQVKYALTQLYGTVKGFLLHELTDAAVKRKIDLCYELLEIADKLDPGWTLLRGRLLLDLQEIVAVQVKREYNSGLITREAAQEKLMESMTYLQEAVDILKLEPGMDVFLENRVDLLAREIEME